MKFLYFLMLAGTCISSCSNNHSNPQTPPSETEHNTAEAKQFFPVTSFIKGEINLIRQSEINPKKTEIIDGRKDSLWLKMQDLPTAFSPFLSPVIDTSNVREYFKETSFLDETIGAYTFTYEPAKQLPENFSLKRWDVYIDQQRNKVNRIYLQKQWGDTVQQLTWLAGNWAKIITIVIKNNRESIQRETTIQWKFDE